jgi:glycerate kinase
MGCIEPGCNIHTGITSQITNLRDALRVWPNPVASGGEVTVLVTMPEGLRKEALRVSVVSSDGKLVEERVMPPQTSTFTIRTSNYASGLYHVHLTSGSTWVGGTRFVVE